MRSRVTPDILFEQEVCLQGVPQPVRWIDSKNGWFVPGLTMESKIKSLRRQALKYEFLLGRGVFLWHKGFFEDLRSVTSAGIHHVSMHKYAAPAVPSSLISTKHSH